MKKLLVVLLSLMVVLGCTATIFAEGEQVPSVPAKGDVGYQGGGYDPDDVGPNPEDQPKVSEDGNKITYTAADGCQVAIVVTPYASKNTMHDPVHNNATDTEGIADVDEAFNDVKTSNTLIQQVANNNVVNKNGYSTSELVVSNLFDVSIYTDEKDVGNDHDDNMNHHRIYEISVGADVIDKFVALAHYDAVKDEWEIIENAVADKTKGTITFTYPTHSPFAVIIHKAAGGNDEPSIPNTGADTTINVVPYIAASAVIVAAACIFMKKRSNAK